MRHCRGAQLSWTLGKTCQNYSHFPHSPPSPFPQSTPVLRSKTIVKVQKNINPERNIYKNSFSSRYKKNVVESFLYFPLSSGGFLYKRNEQPWRKVTASGNSNIYSLTHSEQKCFWVGLTKRCFCLSLGKRRSNYSSSLLQLDTHYDTCNRGEVALRRNVGFFYPQEKQKHKPSSSSYCFLILKLFCKAAIFLLFS